MKKKRIAVAMSGGVDSSVAAALIARQGHDVIGITMCLSLPDPESGKPACCGAQGIDDARRVCGLLGIRHYVLDFGKEMREKVIADFISEYKKGRTPNPCVRCNELLKFDALLRKVKGLGFDFLATGHYARIRKRGSVCYLTKAKDLSKDQSYFLYRLTQDKLRHIVFPLGEMTKTQVRDTARKLGLPVAEKKESQEICFIPGDYRNFLEASGALGRGPGDFVDKEGKVLGRHRGIGFYTIGQRNGLGIARGYPVYVSEIDSANNRVIIGDKDALMKREFLVTDVVFPSGRPRKKGYLCRIRHLSREARASVEIGDKTVTACFSSPQFAITPGQSAVFYDGETVRCGGIIDKVTG
ncbi:MAG: tRNA 2-thiouridine(34) synthase MnmA [Deltaproteobacteria bacterium]